LQQFTKEPGKWIPVKWESGIDKDFSAELKTVVKNKPGALAEVALEIGKSGSNIEQVSVNEDAEDMAEMTFLIMVRDRTHLANVLRGIRKMPHVERVFRVCA
jgi:(p)ppGpp synthase/HD superfamily hydrolase